MKPKTVRTLYWIFAILFSLLMLMDAIGGITLQQAGIDALQQLGYPIYLLRFFGVLKILGLIAILVPGFPRLREWAFAGFAFNFIGALFSWSSVGQASNVIFPVIALVLLALIYFFNRKAAMPAIAA
ncbi:DoxX family protein [Taibaiella koreensis]|uniref:DoxX family protein n=1 Tax=Taibaiella koreensis TaxID=1268548 RepID=UPI000E59AD25|nr:DoxX family protein [Taibaiella koreensis]